MNTITTWLAGAVLFASLDIYAQDKRLSLEEALLIAREHNKGLKVRMLATGSAKEETSIARAAMLPTVTASAGYSYFFDRSVIFMPGALAGNETEPVVDVAVGGKNAFNTYISAHQPVLSEAARRQIKAARINESIKELEVEDHRADLTVLVASTYYKALLLGESIGLNRQSLSRNLRSLDDSRVLMLQGKSLKVDTLRNFIIVENLKTTISALENQRKVTLLQLQQLLGLRQDAELMLSDSLEKDNRHAYLAAAGTIHPDAAAGRPDVKMHQLNVEWSKAVLGMHKAQRIPTLSLAGMYQLQAQSDNREFSTYRWPRTTFVGLQANMPIFSGNRINARVRQSNLHLRGNLLQLEDATERANTEIATLQNNLNEVIERSFVQERTVEAAEINFRIIDDRYKNGLSTRLELSDAELALTEAKLNQLHLTYNIKIAKLLLDRALGTL